MKTNYLIKHFIGSLVFFAILFISAGRLNYWQGLLYVLIGLIMLTMNYTVLKVDPELLGERSTAGENTPSWDKAILGLSFLTTISMYIIAGLDSGRFHWSPNFHWSIILAGILLTALGQILFLVAQKQNRFFFSTVRIQTEREHKVCDTGLYCMVRHPGYLGMMLQSVGFPLLFESLWSFLPIALMLILLVTRTYLEDKMLINELKGYSEYAQKTRYRIIPYVW